MRMQKTNMFLQQPLKKTHYSKYYIQKDLIGFSFFSQFVIIRQIKK